MFSCSFRRGDKKELVVFMKTSRRFYENEPSFLWKQAVVFMKTSRRFCENQPSLLWKRAVVFMKTSRRFCENEPSFRDVRCVVLSKKFLWFFGEGNKKTEPSSDSVYCLLWLKKGAIRHMLWKKYRANAVLSILCSVMWHWTFNRLLLNRNPRLRRGERLQSHRGHDDLS